MHRSGVKKRTRKLSVVFFHLFFFIFLFLSIFLFFLSSFLSFSQFIYFSDLSNIILYIQYIFVLYSFFIPYPFFMVYLDTFMIDLVIRLSNFEILRLFLSIQSIKKPLDIPLASYFPLNRQGQNYHFRLRVLFVTFPKLQIILFNNS